MFFVLIVCSALYWMETNSFTLVLLLVVALATFVVLFYPLGKELMESALK